MTNVVGSADTPRKIFFSSGVDIATV